MMNIIPESCQNKMTSQRLSNIYEQIIQKIPKGCHRVVIVFSKVVKTLSWGIVIPLYTVQNRKKKACIVQWEENLIWAVKLSGYFSELL